MVDTGSVIRFMFPSAVPLVDYEASIDAAGVVTFRSWNAAKLGPQPTQAQIEAQRAAAESDQTTQATKKAQAVAFLKGLPAGDMTTAQLSNGLRAVRFLLKDIYQEIG